MVARVMKMLPTIRKPFAVVHRMLKKQGFADLEDLQGRKYETELIDPVSCKTFRLTVPVHVDKGICEVSLKAAKVEEEERVPAYVADAALSKLWEIADYLRSNVSREEETGQTAMAPVQEEMSRPGRVMRPIPPAAELKTPGQITHPRLE